MKKHSALIGSVLTILLLTTMVIGVNAQDEDTILVGHLTYHTGPFAEVGPHFDGVTDFTLSIINENPPLGRVLIPIHEDIGTIGEARAARKVVIFDGAEILLNPAHGYNLYRDWIQGYVANNNRPIMPSVHGGAIERSIGGNSDEPLFRGSPMDSAQSVAAVIKAHEAGAENIVIIAANLDGHQLQKNSAIRAVEELGMNLLDVIDTQAELPNYLNEANQVKALEPDAVLVFTPAIDGGTIVKNLSDVDLSTTVIGTTEWQSMQFLNAATDDAIEAHEAVWVVAFAHTDSPAWEYYETRWNESAYADLAPAENSYNLQYYDLLIVTALAIESAGTTDANLWVEHMPNVAQEPGKVVYTYAEAIEALRNGEAIDYSGVSGEMNYTETGVVSGLFGIFEWNSDHKLELTQVLDDVQVLELDHE